MAKDKFGASPNLIADVVQLLFKDTVMAESHPLVDMSLKDAADIAIISSAIHGSAELLVTGDKEILTLKRIGVLEIVTPRQFWERQRDQLH